MSTKIIIPRASGEGGIGDQNITWGEARFDRGFFGDQLKIQGKDVLTEVSAGDLSDFNFDGNAIEGFDASLTELTASHTLSASDAGKVLTFNSSSAVNLSVPSGLDKGFCCSAIQLGSGQITFVGSGVTINNRQGHTKTVDQYSAASLICVDTNQFVLAGDTQ